MPLSRNFTVLKYKRFGSFMRRLVTGLFFSGLKLQGCKTLHDTARQRSCRLFFSRFVSTFLKFPWQRLSYTGMSCVTHGCVTRCMYLCYIYFISIAYRDYVNFFVFQRKKMFLYRPKIRGIENLAFLLIISESYDACQKGSSKTYKQNW